MAARGDRPRRVGGDPAVPRAPPGLDQDAVVQAAAERGVAVQAAAPLRAGRDRPPALMLGFARLPEHRIAEAVGLLAEAASAQAGPQGPRGG